jgi:uncharacterized protein YggE
MQATTVAAQGTAETDFNFATFSVALSAEGKTAPEAKTNLKKQVDDLTQALEAMKTNLTLKFVKDSVNTSTNVQERWIYNNKKGENEFEGFTASYRYSFQIDDLDKVSEVYDVLSSLEEVTTSSPSFSIKTATRDRVNKKALKDAFRKVQERFETECSVLGLNAADFEIASWEATYSDSQRSDRVSATTRRVGMARAAAYSADDALESAPIAAAAPAGGGRAESEPLEIVVGKAKVYANLEVGYAKRVTQALNAEVVKKPSHSQENQNHV